MLKINDLEKNQELDQTTMRAIKAGNLQVAYRYYSPKTSVQLRQSGTLVIEDNSKYIAGLFATGRWH